MLCRPKPKQMLLESSLTFIVRPNAASSGILPPQQQRASQRQNYNH
jgi:hypothetical protein